MLGVSWDRLRLDRAPVLVFVSVLVTSLLGSTLADTVRERNLPAAPSQEERERLAAAAREELERLVGVGEDTPGCSAAGLGIPFSFDVNTTAFTAGIPAGQGVPFSQQICFDHDTPLASVCGLDVNGGALAHAGSSVGICVDTSAGPNPSTQQGSASGRVATSSAFTLEGTFVGLTGEANPISLDNSSGTATSMGVGTRGLTDANMSVLLDTQGTHRLAGVYGELRGQSITGGNPNQACVAAGVIGVDSFTPENSSVETWAGCFQGDVNVTGAIRSGVPAETDFHTLALTSQFGPGGPITANGDIAIGFQNYTLPPSGPFESTFDQLNVGIGTLEPAEQLHVRGDRQNLAVRVDQMGSTAAVLRLRGGTGGKQYGLYSTGVGNTPQGPGKLLFFDDTALGETALIGSNGFFGLGAFGTANPTHRFHVKPGGVRLESLPATTTEPDLLTVNASGVVFRRDVSTLPSAPDADWDIIVPDIKFAQTGKVLPNTTQANDLGSSTLRWKDLYLGSKVDYSADLEFQENGTPRAIIKAGGNVGIGTTAPSTKLEVKGPGTGIFRLQPNAGTENLELVFGAASPTLNRAKIFSSGSGGDAGGDLRFSVNLTALEAMVIRSSGNVGIGTNNPSHRLHVNTGGVRFVGLPASTQPDLLVVDGLGVVSRRNVSTLPSDADWNVNAPDINFAQTGKVLPNTSQANDLGSSTLRWKDLYLGSKVDYSSDLEFQENGTSRAIIKAGGNVGIGTTAPATPMEISRTMAPSEAHLLRLSNRGDGSAFTESGLHFAVGKPGNSYIGGGRIYSKYRNNTEEGGMIRVAIGDDAGQFADALAVTGRSGMTGAGEVRIQDVLHIRPRSQAPISEIKLGDLYVDSDTNTLCFYNGSAWTPIGGAGPCI